jgi:hypothetical protein
MWPRPGLGGPLVSAVMPKLDQRATVLVTGSALGAAVRYLVAGLGPLATIVGTGTMIVVAGFVAGVALGWRPGLIRSFALGLAGSIASFSLYAVLGVTSAPLVGFGFLIAVPILTATALTLGVLVGLAWARPAERNSTP